MITIPTNLTENELEIINVVKALRPFEKIEITADKDGVADCYLIHKSQKFILNNKGRTNTRTSFNN